MTLASTTPNPTPFHSLEKKTPLDVSETAALCGFNHATELSAAAWSDCVRWDVDDSICQQIADDLADRLWNVLHVGCKAAQRAIDSQQTTFRYLVYRIKRDGMSRQKEPVSIYGSLHSLGKGRFLLRLELADEVDASPLLDQH